MWLFRTCAAERRPKTAPICQYLLVFPNFREKCNLSMRNRYVSMVKYVVFSLFEQFLYANNGRSVWFISLLCCSRLRIDVRVVFVFMLFFPVFFMPLCVVFLYVSHFNVFHFAEWDGATVCPKFLWIYVPKQVFELQMI